MKEIVERLTENRQIERAKSILENAGYKVSEAKFNVKGSPRTYSVNRLKVERVSWSDGDPSILKRMVDMNDGANNYVDYPEIFEIFTEEAMDEMTEYLGCRREDLVELGGREEDGFPVEGYQKLCDYVYKNSHRVSDIMIPRGDRRGPSDSLSPSVMDDGSGVKYVFHMDGDSYPGFIVSQNIK